MTTFGMCVEVHSNGKSIFWRSEVSNQDIEDARAVFLDQTVKARGHQALREKIPISPSVTQSQSHAKRDRTNE